MIIDIENNIKDFLNKRQRKTPFFFLVTKTFPIFASALTLNQHYSCRFFYVNIQKFIRKLDTNT